MIMERQKHILDLMEDGTLKEKTSALLRQMDSLPGSRRMSVMPGFKFQEESHKVGHNVFHTIYIYIYHIHNISILVSSVPISARGSQTRI